MTNKYYQAYRRRFQKSDIFAYDQRGIEPDVHETERRRVESDVIVVKGTQWLVKGNLLEAMVRNFQLRGEDARL